MTTYNEAMKILAGSKEFTFNGQVLVVRDYYTGKKVELDFGFMTEEIYNELTVKEDAVIQYNEDEDEWEIWNETGDDLWETFLTKEACIEWCDERDIMWEEQW